MWQQLKCISIRSQPSWPENVCPTVLLGFCVWDVCVRETANSKSIHVIKDTHRYTLLEAVLNPENPHSSSFLELIHHLWQSLLLRITGFASIRAVLSWLKLYYWEIRERLEEGATNLPAGQTAELASKLWLAFSKTTDVEVCEDSAPWEIVFLGPKINLHNPSVVMPINCSVNQIVLN